MRCLAGLRRCLARAAEAVPYRFWPAVFVMSLWMFVIASDWNDLWFDRVFYMLDPADFYYVALALTVVVAPFTAFLLLFPGMRRVRGSKAFQALTKGDVVRRVLMAFGMIVVVGIFWPSPRVSYTYTYEANAMKTAQVDDWVDSLSPEVKDALPRGESRIVDLPEIPDDVFYDMGLFEFRMNDGIDHWGNPYMFVAEDRKDGLWVGIYSKGQDGVSHSRGNDPDDQNTWGQYGHKHYGRKIMLQNLIQLGVQVSCLFLFFLPICLQCFRRRVEADTALSS